jgi:hypothetical protein
MAVGHSDDVDSHIAIEAVIGQCRSSLGDHRPSAGLLFSAADAFEPNLIQSVRAAFPDITLVGSTSSAELSSAGGYLEDSIALALFASDAVQIGAGLGSGLGDDVDAACKAAVHQALEHVSAEPRVCIVFHESFVVDPPIVVDAITRTLPEGTIVLGGTSARSDFVTVTPTYQFRNEDVVSDGVAVMIFGGPVASSIAVGAGFRMLGSKGTVTVADALAVHEIDGRPAVEFLKRYLDVTGPAAYANPLAVREDGSADFYLRVIRPTEADSGSLIGAGSVPVGATVQLTTTSTDEILAGTKEALDRAVDTFPPNATPEAALIFSCAVRKFFLGSRTREEADLARSVLGDIPTAGMYCYGEIGPVPGMDRSRFLNETFVALLLGT